MNSIALLPHLDLQSVTGNDRLGEANFDSLEERWVVVGVLLDDRTHGNSEERQAMQDWLSVGRNERFR